MDYQVAERMFHQARELLPEMSVGDFIQLTSERSTTTMTTEVPSGTEEASEFEQAIESSRQACAAHEERMGWSQEYPDNIMLDEDFKLRLSAKRALRRFRAAKPYRHEGAAFIMLVDILYSDLSEIYGIPCPRIKHEGEWEGTSGGSNYDPSTHTITLKGKKSIITTLHEFAHARGYGEHGAVWWSVNIFRLLWPKSFEQLEAEGHFLNQPEQSEEDPNMGKDDN